MVSKLCLSAKRKRESLAEAVVPSVPSEPAARKRARWGCARQSAKCKRDASAASAPSSKLSPKNEFKESCLAKKHSTSVVAAPPVLMATSSTSPKKRKVVNARCQAEKPSTSVVAAPPVLPATSSTPVRRSVCETSRPPAWRRRAEAGLQNTVDLANASAQLQPAVPCSNMPAGCKRKRIIALPSASARRKLQAELQPAVPKFDLADPVASELLQPLSIGSSAARAQRQAMAVACRGNASSSTKTVAKLGNYGRRPANIERDLHAIIRQKVKLLKVPISYFDFTVLDLKAMKRAAPQNTGKRKKFSRKPKVEQITVVRKWPVLGPR